MLQAAIDNSQEHVDGTVRLKLYKGNCTMVGRKSPNSLYSEADVTFEDDRAPTTSVTRKAHQRTRCACGLRSAAGASEQV